MGEQDAVVSSFICKFCSFSHILSKTHFLHFLFQIHPSNFVILVIGFTLCTKVCIEYVIKFDNCILKI